MSFALSAGVTGLQAHQKMLDIAGNNLANVNTTAFKAKRITFSELLSNNLKKASQPTETIGGTNPQQMGSGVGVANISPNLNQGNIVSTGNPLDIAIEGEGYFVVSDGQADLYTRAGAFAVDSNSNLVDPSTGNFVQRIGSTGEADGFQTPGDSNIKIPYDAAIPARATSNISFAGNLSADAVMETPQTQVLESSLVYTSGGDAIVDGTTEIDQLDQFSGGSGAGGQLDGGVPESGTITISGYTHDGTTFSDALTAYAGGNPADLNFTVNDGTTVEDFVNHLNNNVLVGDNGTATAELVDGKIQITDGSNGYSKLDVKLAYSGDGQLETPGYFEIETTGGEEVKDINRIIYDSKGGEHVLSASFVRTNTENQWDFVLKSITGDLENIDMQERRIDAINFDAHTGAYLGLAGADSREFKMTFAQDTGNPQTVEMDFGSTGQLNGLTQYSGPSSTAVARKQDGYKAGRLSTVSVNNEGILIGAFSNGMKKEIATLQIALFQNPSGLESAGNSYFTSSANSGEAVATEALTSGAGKVWGGRLEKSNADVASEFVNMIQAQNGFQANARTIRVANDVLRELTSLIR